MHRLDRLRTRMAEAGVDLVALAPGAHLSWLLDVRPHADERPLLACITASHVGFLMPALEAESARQQTDLPFYEWADAQGPQEALAHLLRDFGAQNAASIALDEAMRADHAALVQDQLPNASRQFSETTVGALRMRKDADEYKAFHFDSSNETGWSFTGGDREIGTYYDNYNGSSGRDVSVLFSGILQHFLQERDSYIISYTPYWLAPMQT